MVSRVHLGEGSPRSSQDDRNEPCCTRLRIPIGALVIIGLALAFPVSAQRAPANVAIRPLGAVVSTSTISFQQIQHLRALSNGTVLINDPGKRQVILLDSALANPKVVVDSAGGANMYGMNAGALIPFAGDSTLFVDRNASAFL